MSRSGRRCAVLICVLLGFASVLPAQTGSPPPLNHEELRRAEDLKTRLRPLQERLLEPGTSREEIEAILTEAGPLARELAQLQSRIRGGESPPETPVLSGVAPDPDPPTNRGALDTDALYRLFREYLNLETVHAASHGTPDEAASWIDLAQRLRPFADREAGFDPAGDDPLVWRATLLYGACRLHASVGFFRGGGRKRQHREYVEGLRTLENLLSAFRAAKSIHQSGVDGCETLAAPLPPHTGVEYAGVAPRGLSGHLLSPGQGKTSVRGQALLTEFCPWGLAAYERLHADGLTLGLDWRILKPFAGAGEQPLVSVSAVSGGVSPATRAEMGRVRDGLVIHRGKSLALSWERKPPAATYTVWFASPELSRIRASTYVGWGLKAIKLIVGGPLDLMVDETIGLLVGTVGREYGEDSQVYLGAKTAETLNNLGLDSDFLIDGRDFKGGKPPKVILKAFLEWLEDETIKLTFEGFDPESTAVRSQVGTPISYDGSPVPMVAIRGDVLGFERVPSHRFRRTWNVISLSQLDPRFLTADRSYDLSTGTPPRPATGSSGETGAAWKKLPDPLGDLLVLGDMTPQVQVVRLLERPEIVKGWRAAVRQGETLAALLYRRAGDPTPVAFHEIGDREISFRIKNDEQLARDGSLTNIFWPEVALGSWSTSSPRCYYTVKVAVVAKSAAYTHAGEWGSRSDYSWAKPKRILATRPARFLHKADGRRTGGLDFPTKGCMVLNLAPTAPRPTPTPAPAGPGKLSGRVDPQWLQQWTAKHFRYGREMGSPDFLEVQPLRYEKSDAGGWSFNDCQYVVRHWTKEAGGGPPAYRSTTATVRHGLTIAGVEGSSIHGTYTSEATAQTHVFVPSFFGTKGKKSLKALRGTGRWRATKMANGSWRLELTPGPAAIPVMRIPLVFTLTSES